MRARGFAEKTPGIQKKVANVEAIAHLRRGIEALDRLTESTARDELDLDLQLALGPCIIATQGATSSAATATFDRASKLCEKLGHRPEYLQVMNWLYIALAVRG